MHNIIEENYNLPLDLPNDVLRKCKVYMKISMDKSETVKLGQCLRRNYAIAHENGMAVIYYLPDWVT